MHESDTCFYNLESPPAGTTIAPGWQQLRGWLVPKRGFHFVDIRARSGDRVFPGVYGFPRVDLAAHFEPARTWLPAEYTIEIELHPGPSEVTVEALGFTGEWQRVQTIVMMSAGAPVRKGENDPLNAEEYALAVQLHLKQAQSGDLQAAKIASSLPYPRILRANHPPFHGYIDEPATLAPALYGRVSVLGWLFHETSGIRRAYVSTDLMVFHQLALGGETPGVQRRFPSFPNSRDCQFYGFADVPSQFVSPANMRIYAELQDGSMHLCLASRCRPIAGEEIKAPYPRFSLLKFWTARREIGQAIAGLKIPTRHRNKQLWASVREYWREAPPGSANVRYDPLPDRGVSLPARSSLLLISHNLNLEGAPLFLLEYAAYLIKTAKAKVLVLAGQDGPLREAFTQIGAEVKIVDVADFLGARSCADLRRRTATLARQLVGEKIDAVVANTLFGFWGVHVAVALRRPALLYIHESISPAVFFKKRIRPNVLPAVYEALHRATAVNFLTSATQAYYDPSSMGGNFQLTPGWIDLSSIKAFRAAHSSGVLRERLKLAARELLVANIGTVCDRKGQHDFVRAVEWLWRSNPELARRCRFLMIGGRDTHYNRSLQQTISDLGRPNVQIVPETSEVYDFFGAADLFLCTSYEESFPRVILEAMAFEVPIVSTNVHGIPHILRPQTDALLVNPGDVTALAQAMREVAEHPIDAKERAKNAFERVREFDASAVLPRHAELTAAVVHAKR
jgi:glycosyltransferase involved in cell wall biosynthesis